MKYQILYIMCVCDRLSEAVRWLVENIWLHIKFALMAETRPLTHSAGPLGPVARTRPKALAKRWCVCVSVCLCVCK